MSSPQGENHLPVPGEGAFLIKAPFAVCSFNQIISPAYVTVRDGKIADVSKNVPDGPFSEIVQCPENSVLLPGLINAHTHLELQHLKGTGRGLQFFEWISEITRKALTTDPTAFATAADEGALVQIAGGVTSVGDHSTFAVSPEALKRTGLKGRVFREFFSPDPDFDPTENLIAIRNWMEAQVPHSGVSYGISPHAPYNAPPTALSALQKIFPEAPRSIHVSESREEDDYIRNGSGAFADKYLARGFMLEARNCSPVEYLINGDHVKPSTLCVHLTHASEADLLALAEIGAVGVFCPVSNANLGCGIPPIGQALKLGILSTLATDSAVSHERQDLFEEARVAILGSRLRGHPITEKNAFEMITENPAKALGFNSGSITPENSADLCLVELPFSPDSENVIAEVIWNASRECIRKVWIDGVLRYAQ